MNRSFARVGTPKIARFKISLFAPARSAVSEIRLHGPDRLVLPSELFHSDGPRILGERHQEGVAAELPRSPDAEAAEGVRDRPGFRPCRENHQVLAGDSRLARRPSGRRGRLLTGRLAAGA